MKRHFPGFGQTLIYKIIVQHAAVADAREYATFVRQETKSSDVASRWLY